MSSALSTTKATAQLIYRLTFPPPPTDDDYSPPTFNGPQRRIEALHNFPRAGFLNDIAAVTGLGAAAIASHTTETDGILETVLGKTVENTSAVDFGYLEYISPSETSGIEYDRKDAMDYIKGIAVVGVLVLLIYIIWGMCLILLRMGRIDWCFRLWCCRKRNRKNVNKKKGEDNDNGDEQLDLSSTRAMMVAEDEEEDEDINTDCCCITCRESIRAKGGCCTRNVFCGWLAGKPPKVPTRASLMKEEELRSKRLIGSGKSVSEMVAKLKSGGSKEDGGDEVVAAAADGGGDVDMAVAAVDNSGTDAAADPQDKAGLTKSNQEIIITDEYLQKRQKASRRTMLGIRITFLISAVLVIIFSIKLCFDGYRGINGIIASTDRGINKVAEHIDEIKTEVENYIATNEEMKQRKEEWLNQTRSQIQSGFEDRPWCPLALMNNGTIDVDVSLAKLLLRGNLFKLALVDKVDEVKDQLVGGVSKRNIVTDVNQSVQTAVGAIGSAVQTAETVVGSAVQTAGNAIGDVTGDLTNVACTTVEECQKRSEELGLIFKGSGEFESHGCFTVEGGLTYFGLGTLEQIVAPNVEGSESTLHERLVCKAATAVAENLVNNAVDGAIDTAKEKVFTVVTFLDDLRNGEGGKIQAVLGGVLGLRGLIGGDDASRSLAEKDDNERIKMLVAKLTTLVRSLIAEGANSFKDIIPSGGNERALQIQPSDAREAITETIVEKGGINYTILTLADNFTGTDLIINGYNVTKLFTTNLTVDVDVATLTERINEKLEESSSTLLDIFVSLQSGLENTYQQLRNAQDSLESITPYFTVAVIFAAVLIVLTSFFIIGTILAWVGKQPRCFRCAQDGIILPIFILVGLLVWIFTVVFLTLGVMTGDYCVVTPDVQMSEIFEQTLAKLSPVGYKFAFYYFNGCRSELRPLLMSVAYNIMLGIRVGLDQFFELVGNLGEGPLRQACGLGSETDITTGDPVNALSILANVLRNHVGTAMTATNAIFRLTLCKSVYPVYAFLAHQVVCTDFVNLIGPLFSSLFVISIFSMLMVTMRVAWHELVEEEVAGGDDDKMQDCLEADEVAQMDGC